MTLRQIVLMGDSLTQGTGPVGTTSSIAEGGQGCWAELVAERLANLAGIGPLVGAGLRGFWTGILAGTKDGEWTKTGSWTKTASTDAFDKAPYGYAYQANAGTGDVATWTRPTQYRPVTAVAVDYIDTGGNWQYRIDGGTWTNHGQTIQSNNAYKRFHLASAVSSTIEFRAYDGANSTACCLVGIHPYYSNPVGATSGLIVHNLGVNGERLHQGVLATSGDRLAFFDAVTLGTGSPITSTPNAGVSIMHINDVTLGSSTNWGTDLTTFNTRVSSMGPVAFLSPWEADTGTYNQTQQTNYRAETTSKATSLSAKLYDIYSAWSLLGFTANAGAVAAGFLATDQVHESQAGHIDLAERLYWFFRTKILGVNPANDYTVDATRAAVQYAGKRAAVQYAALLPEGVG